MGVIDLVKLDENRRHISTYMSALIEEMESYRLSALRGISFGHPNIEFSDMPVSLVEDKEWELRTFLNDLERDIEGADSAALSLMESIRESYEKHIVNMLVLLEPSRQRGLLKIFDGRISQAGMIEIRKNLEVEKKNYVEEQERVELESWLELNKESLMKEYNMKSEEEYQSFMEDQRIILRLWQEYREEITKLEAMSFEEQREFIGVPTARSDFIFLQQLEGYTYEERIKILEVLQEKGQIREAEFLEILGETKRFMDVRCAYVNSTYSLSIKEVAFDEYMEHATIEGNNKSFLAMNAIMTPHIMNIHSEYVKPSVNNSNLDMNNRFDRMEYESIYGRDIPPQQVLQPKPGDAEFIGALPSEGTDYTAPKGGGGVTSTVEANGKMIDFGHGGRHLDGTGLDVNAVNETLANEVSKVHPGTGQFYKGQIVINGITIEYTSYGVSDGVINIGTYYPVK